MKEIYFTKGNKMQRSISQVKGSVEARNGSAFQGVVPKFCCCWRGRQGLGGINPHRIFPEHRQAGFRWT